MSDLNKLTVPQLKALCKERGISGYSKLAKAALLQKLANIPTASVATASQVVPLQTDKAGYTTESHSARHQAKAVHKPVKPPTVSRGVSTPSTPLSAGLPRNRTVTRTREASAKRPAHIDTSVPAKRKKTIPQPATSAGSHQLPRADTTLQERLPNASIFKLPVQAPGSFDGAASMRQGMFSSALQIPDLPVQHSISSHVDASTLRDSFSSVPELPVELEISLHGSASTLQETRTSVLRVPKLPVQFQTSFHAGIPTLAKQISSRRHSGDRRLTTGAFRFKPLMPTKPVELNATNRQPSRRPTVSIKPVVVSTALDFNFRAIPLPTLSNISFPPRASERKWVNKWAIILSALSPTDRKTCMFVSRTFRYAVYLSAVHILSRNFVGRRLNTVFEQHPANMTNFWPYLRFRMDEVSRRRRAFNQSFLGQYINTFGYDPLSAHLWTCPDDEKQVDIALRFVLTRMWFAVSVGAYGHDASKWSKSTIRDIHEIVSGEVWQVVARDEGTGEMGRFYVLDATCEVIGQSQLPGEGTLAYGLRADWTAWIAQRTRAIMGMPSSLLECVTWSNPEDYHCGISKAWLSRVQGQDADSIAKKRVAERYILASVVANGISGQWMSANAMAQEFAGLPIVNGIHGAQRSMHTVNMYLAAHHHIESVHFTTSKGEVLHDAIAVVQTPGREYYVLRDNGMQVGCEEEGIPKVWQDVIGCDQLGREPSLVFS